VFADLGRLMTPWLSGGTSISELLIDPLIDLLVSAMDTIFEVVKLVSDALGAVLDVLKPRAVKLADWLDQTIPIAFFGGFYRGLTGNSLSALDLARKWCYRNAGTSVQRASSGIRRTSQRPSREATDVLR
jgi:hypothetical protein